LNVIGVKIYENQIYTCIHDVQQTLQMYCGIVLSDVLKKTNFSGLFFIMMLISWIINLGHSLGMQSV